MDGAYIENMVKALEENGIKNTRAADRDKWSGGTVSDAFDVLSKRSRDGSKSDLSAMGTKGEQFNLIGYSYGALQASQAALDYADNGGKVDHLVLVGAPISKQLLEQLQKHPNIGKVEVIDLDEHGDPIKAGMSTGDLVMSVPELGLDFSSGVNGEGKGHFYYGGNSPTGDSRRRKLAKTLFDLGLR